MVLTLEPKKMMTENPGPGTLDWECWLDGDFTGSEGLGYVYSLKRKRGQLITTRTCPLPPQLLAVSGFGILSFSTIFLIKPSMQMCNSLIDQTIKALIILLI